MRHRSSVEVRARKPHSQRLANTSARLAEVQRLHEKDTSMNNNRNAKYAPTAGMRCFRRKNVRPRAVRSPRDSRQPPTGCT